MDLDQPTSFAELQVVWLGLPVDSAGTGEGGPVVEEYEG